MKRYISNRVRSSVAEVSNRINASKDVWVVYNTSSCTVGSKKTYGIGRVISEDSRAYQIYSTTSEVYTQVSKRSVLAEFSSEPEADKYYIKLKEEKAVVSSSNSSPYTLTSETVNYLRDLVKGEERYMKQSGSCQTDLHNFATRVLKYSLPVHRMIEYFEEYYPDDYKTMVAKLKELSTPNSESIDNLVNEAVRLYIQEDYDYVESLVRIGEKPVSAYNNPEEEIKFLENVGIVTKDTPYDIKLKVAKQTLNRIKQLDEDLWNKYNS